MRASVPFLAITAVLLVPGVAQAERVSCGQVITHDTRVSNDLVNCPGTGLEIRANGVTLNLAGQTIDGSGGAVGISLIAHDVTIRNGTVRAFGDGVSSFGGTGNVVRGLRLIDNDQAGVLFIGNQAGNVVERNVIYGGTFGVFQSEVFGHAVIRRNVVFDNERFGILQSEGRDTLVVRNLAFGNGADGIAVDPEPSNVLRRNGAFNNGELGIYALGATDAGGNRASGNGDPRQCVGVACR